MQAILKKGVPTFVNYIVLFVCCLFIYPLEIIKNASAGLDPSWELSINLAVKNHFIWGKDFVFSYGPLGYLATGIGVYVDHLPIYMFTLGLYINLCFIFYKVTRQFNTLRIANILTILLFVTTIHNYIYIEASTYLLLSCIFWLSYSIKTDNLLAAIFAISVSILMFFIKMDTGIIINFFTLLFFGYQCIYSKYKRLYPILWILNYTLMWLFSYLMHIDLLNYLMANLHIINSYNDAMYVPNNLTSIFISILIILFFLLLLLQNFLQIIKTPFKVLITFFLMMTLYILYKHGFVRHGGFTFIYPPVSLAILFVFIYFINPERLFYSNLIIYTLIPVSLIFMLIQNIEEINKNDGKLYTIKLSALNSISRLILHKKYTPPVSKLNGVDSSTIPYILPKKIKDKIGSGNVDIIPHLVSTIYFNNLNYNPRPGIQTYANYDGFLDSLGSVKYLSATAPDFIIYCAEDKGIEAAIDKRNPFFDEPKTKIAMLQHYMVIDSFDNQILLKRRDSLIQLSISKPINSKGLLNQPIDIPTSNCLQMLSIKTKYSFLGKLVRFLYQPPSLNVTLTLSTGKQYSYKAIKPIMEEGVLSNFLITTNKDAISLFNGNYTSIPKITKICLSGDKWGFSSGIELISTKITYCNEMKPLNTFTSVK